VVVDLYSGPGGVGCALDDLSVKHIGVDKEDYSDTYPGEFIQADASDLDFIESLLSPDLLWMSPPCQAYSELSWCNSSRLGFDHPKDYYATFDDLNVREVIDVLDPDHYIIENVRSAADL
jgi:site-specific DNA-cytosine methylase